LAAVFVRFIAAQDLPDCAKSFDADSRASTRQI